MSSMNNEIAKPGWPLSSAPAGTPADGSLFHQFHGAGLGDSLRGAVTLFWLAVLQQRAFAMQFGELGAYEWAFDQPHFNWSWYGLLPA
jgi:hypothetical protein